MEKGVSSMEDKEKVLDFIKGEKLGVVATKSAKGEVQSAVMGFGETDKFEIFFGTDVSSRKYKNLQTNPDVAFVIGWDEGVTVQYEGVARELSDGEEKIYKEMYYEKTPSAKKYDGEPGERYFLVSPKWVRYTDLKKEPWEIIELEF